jgi:hypothetical protein
MASLPIPPFHRLLLVALTSLALQQPVIAAGQPGSWSQGTYIWDSKSLLDPQQREGELRELRRAGMTELMVGLSGSQVKAGAVTQRQLKELIDRAHHLGFRVQLLLGDPEWILPSGRQGLLALIRLYRNLPFDGLHLDLEVEQLGWPVPPQRLRDWISTLEAAAQLSPWPVNLSSHPRWFETTDTKSPCIPCAIRPSQQVSLMIYTRNPQRSAARALAIARRWPKLRLRLAQSVEAGLEPGLSWQGSTAGALQVQVQRWRQQLGPDGVGGIDWQDWQAYPGKR